MNRILFVLALISWGGFVSAEIKSERFDNDPAWDAYRNRIEPKQGKTVKQDFGYRAESNFAGKAKGEIGGTIWRCSKPASYADKIEPKTLNDKLSASGTFAITATAGSSGAFFGWFKADQEDAGRQNSLGFRFAGEGSGARITFQLVTATNQACGTKITPWVVDKNKPKGQGRKFRPTSIRNDGTRYAWKMDYDPDGNGGAGQMHFSIAATRRSTRRRGKETSRDCPPATSSTARNSSALAGASMRPEIDDGYSTIWSKTGRWRIFRGRRGAGVRQCASYERANEAARMIWLRAGRISRAARRRGNSADTVWRSGAMPTTDSVGRCRWKTS